MRPDIAKSNKNELCKYNDIINFYKIILKWRKKMVDLEIMKNGEAILNRDVKIGEKISYQNDYLKKIGEIGQADVLVDLDKDSKLIAGGYAEGKTVITDKSVEVCDWLIVKAIQ